MWTYIQHTGELQLDNQHVDNGYSGFGEGKNNPDMEAVENVGPIPHGDWTISGPPVNTAEHGPYVLTLTPVDAATALGRSGFLMHGDSIEHPGEASKGCIIMPHDTRVKVWTSGDTDLQVVPEVSTQDVSDSTAS
jgi:Tlde1 domain